MDAVLSDIIEGVCRGIDRYCRRRFYVETATRYFDSVSSDRLCVGDVLSVSGVSMDSELDGTFDGESWVFGTDYELRPFNRWPKWDIYVLPFGNYALATQPRYVKVIGDWGYGDGRRSDPVDAVLDSGSAVTGTTADASTKTLTISVADAVAVGQTLRVGAERMYVEGVSGVTVTVVRAVNGSTAATHAGVAVEAYTYPASVRLACMNLAQLEYAARGKQGLEFQRIGNFSERYRSPALLERDMGRMLGGLKVPGVG